MEHRGPEPIRYESDRAKAIEEFVNKYSDLVQRKNLDQVKADLENKEAIVDQSCTLHEAIIEYAREMVTRNGCFYLRSVSTGSKDATIVRQLGTKRTEKDGVSVLECSKEGGIVISLGLPFCGKNGKIHCTHRWSPISTKGMDVEASLLVPWRH